MGIKIIQSSKYGNTPDITTTLQQLVEMQVELGVDLFSRDVDELRVKLDTLIAMFTRLLEEQIRDETMDTKSLGYILALSSTLTISK